MLCTRLRVLVAVAWLVAVPWGTLAHAAANPADRAAAQALFNRALELMKAGDYAGACPQLEESQKLDPAVGTLLYLGDCYEQQDRVASAWATFNAASEAARGARQRKREEMARQRADALEPKLPKIIIAVYDEDRVPGLEVTRNSVPIREGAWGVPVPVDAGRYEVRASAPGRTTWTAHVTLHSAGTVRTIRIPRLEPAQHLSAATDTPTTPLPDPNDIERADQANTNGLGPGDGMRVAGAVVGGTGLVGIVLGIVYGVKARAKEADSEPFCQPPDYVLCTQPGLDLLDEAATASTIANVGFVVGGALAATGLVLVLAAPSDGGQDSGSSRAARAWTVAPLLGPAAAGIEVGTSW